MQAKTREVRLSDYTLSAPAGAVRMVSVHKSLLAANDAAARANRERFRHCLVVNIVSSPGAGKTALLEQTFRSLAGELEAGVIVGDLETDNDARRLRSAGVSAVQVATGTVCHLEAEMVARAAEGLEPNLDLLVIENVGNLVCPAAWDLGEDLRVVLLSVAEGEDKPLKYPRIFKAADAVVISKLDLAEAVGWDREGALGAIRQVSPRARLFELSARTGVGMEGWYGYLRERLAEKRGA